MRWLGSGPRVLAAGCEGLLTGFLDGRKVLLGQGLEELATSPGRESHAAGRYGVGLGILPEPEDPDVVGVPVDGRQLKTGVHCPHELACIEWDDYGAPAGNARLWLDWGLPKERWAWSSSKAPTGLVQDWLRMRDELPEECMRELDYRALVETLALLEDENVCLSMSGLESHSGEKGPLVTVSGVLHKAGHSGNSFAIGASGRLVLYEQDFVSASLRTYDGNDYFTLTIHFSKVSIVLSDEIYGLEAPTTSA